MQLKNNCCYTLITPLMVLIVILGLTFRDNNRKHFYIPIGVIGVYLVAEREYRRKTDRYRILNRIKNFQENK